LSTKKKKRRRKSNYYVVTISDNPKLSTHSRRMTGGSRQFWSIVIACIVILIIAFVAFMNYRGQLIMSKELAYQQSIEQLRAENAELKTQNDLLNEKITILSETVTQKNEVVQAIEERSLPTGFPLSIAADVNEKEEKLELDGAVVSRPMIEFTAPEGTYVLAAGDGTVTYVSEEVTYGWEVMVDHENGYVTSYRTSAEPKVKVGDEVSRGSLLFEMKADDDEPAVLAYQMKLNDEFINPTDILEING